MNTKKEIRNFLDEYFMGRIDKPCNRKIYLTDKDYVEVEITENLFRGLIISLHMNNSEFYMFSKDGSINDLDGVWRRFRYRFKRRIAEKKEYGDDKAFAARLKEIYSLL